MEKFSLLPLDMQKEIVGHAVKDLPESIPAMKLVCKRWNQWIVANEVRKTKPTLSNCLVKSAEKGFLELIILYYKLGFARTFNNALEKNQIEAIQNLKYWDIPTIDNALMRAAATGQIKAMKLLKNLGATDFDNALQYAAGGGQILSMEKLVKWNADDFDSALIIAAANGQIEAMKKLENLVIACCPF